MKKIIDIPEEIVIPLKILAVKSDSKDLKNYIQDLLVKDVLGSLPSQGVDITTEGHMNGNWQIKISNIKDANLYDTEMAILKLFGRKKESK